MFYFTFTASPTWTVVSMDTDLKFRVSCFNKLRKNEPWIFLMATNSHLHIFRGCIYMCVMMIYPLIGDIVVASVHMCHVYICFWAGIGSILCCHSQFFSNNCSAAAANITFLQSHNLWCCKKTKTEKVLGLSDAGALLRSHSLTVCRQRKRTTVV